MMSKFRQKVSWIDQILLEKWTMATNLAECIWWWQEVWTHGNELSWMHELYFKGNTIVTKFCSYL